MATAHEILIEKINGIPHKKEKHKNSGKLKSRDILSWNSVCKEEKYTKKEHSESVNLQLTDLYDWNIYEDTEKYLEEDIKKMDKSSLEMLLYNLLNPNKKQYTKNEFIFEELSAELIRCWNKFLPYAEKFSKEEHKNSKNLTCREIRMWNLDFPKQEQYIKEEHKQVKGYDMHIEIPLWNKYFKEKYTKQEYAECMGLPPESFESHFGFFNKLFDVV